TLLLHSFPTRRSSDLILCTVYVLTEDELRERLEPDRVITAIESAFRDRYTSIVISARSHMNLAGGVFLIMACYDGAGHALGIKRSEEHTSELQSLAYI